MAAAIVFNTADLVFEIFAAAAKIACREFLRKSNDENKHVGSVFISSIYTPDGIIDVLFREEARKFQNINLINKTCAEVRRKILNGEYIIDEKVDPFIWSLTSGQDNVYWNVDIHMVVFKDGPIQFLSPCGKMPPILLKCEIIKHHLPLLLTCLHINECGKTHRKYLILFHDSKGKCSYFGKIIYHHKDFINYDGQRSFVELVDNVKLLNLLSRHPIIINSISKIVDTAVNIKPPPHLSISGELQDFAISAAFKKFWRL